MPDVLRLGTRTSRLALWQTQAVADAVARAWPGVQTHLVPFVTHGDTTLHLPLPALGGKGAFTLELEDALREERIDVAVHSLKDLPVAPPDGLTLGAILPREDVRDVLVAREPFTWHTLPRGARVGTSSPRRAAQLRLLRPDLETPPIRGNVETRIRKVMEGQYDATVLALAGVRRLGLEAQCAYYFPHQDLLPAPGQGAIAVQCRANDHRTLALLEPLSCAETTAAVDAERYLLQALQAGCSAPVAAWARRDAGMWRLDLRVHGEASHLDLSGEHPNLDVLIRDIYTDALENGAPALVAQYRHD